MVAHPLQSSQFQKISHNIINEQVVHQYHPVHQYPLSASISPALIVMPMSLENVG